RRGVGDEQRQPLALGLEQLGVRLAAARGEPPVDVARIVPDRILARLRVLHAAPAQRRRRLAADAMPPAPRWPPALRGGAQGDQFGEGGGDAGIAGSGFGIRGSIRSRARPGGDPWSPLSRIPNSQSPIPALHGTGTLSSSSATSRSPSQPSAVAS